MNYAIVSVKKNNDVKRSQHHLGERLNKQQIFINPQNIQSKSL